MKGTNGKLRANVVCQKCNLKGYYESYCPFARKEKEEEEEVEEECNLHAEDFNYIIDSDSDDNVYYF